MAEEQNIKQKANKFRSIVNEMADLYEKKNSNYGDSFGQLFEELGPTAGLVPLWNKLHRATSLIKGDKNNFESLEDTLKDLACYAIMNLIEMEVQKDKEVDSVEKHLTIPNIIPDTKYVTSPKEYGCEDCVWAKKEMYVGDSPCEWCYLNKFKLTSGTHNVTNNVTTSTHTLNNRKGETNNEE